MGTYRARGLPALLAGSLLFGATVVASVFVGSLPASGSPTYTHAVTDTIPVTGHPEAVAVDPITGTVYVVNRSGTRSVISEAIVDDYSYSPGDGGGTAPASGSGIDGSTITLAANTFTYFAGYTFAGWNDGTNTYAAGVTYTLSSDGTPIVFTAQWAENSIDSVAFNSDVGAAVASISGPDGSSITLPYDNYPGYVFNGWFTQASGGTEVGTGGSSYTVPVGGITLFAQWTENTIDTVAFNSDGGAAVALISGPDGSSITLPSDTYPGYVFNGWFTAASGGTEVGVAGSSYTIAAGGVTLFAQWASPPPPTTWTQLSPATSPPARDFASMAYDPATGQMVLFGGMGIGGSYLDDTWTWNGTTWTQQYPATSPSAREFASMAYDPATGQLVLFSGDSSTAAPSTTPGPGTALPGCSSPRPTVPAPVASMAYDSGTGQLVLSGGDSG